MNIYSVLKIPSKRIKPSWRAKNLSDRLIYAFKNQLLTDAEIQVKTEIFKVHKCILACFSPVFENMFYKKTEAHSPYILDDIFPDGFQLLLRMIYQSAFCNTSSRAFHVKLFKFYNVKNVFFAYDAAEKLEMPSMKEELMNALFINVQSQKDPLCLQDFWMLLKSSQFVQHHEIKKKLLIYAKLYPEKVLEAENFFAADMETIELVFNIMDVPEYKIFESVAHWCTRIEDFVDPTMSVQGLLTHVNFRKLSPKEFHAVISKHEDIMSTRDALDIFMHLVDPTACTLPAWCSSEKRNSKDQDQSVLAGKEADLRIKGIGLKDTCRQKLRNGQFADVFLSDNAKKIYPAQKLILALGSSVFEKMLNGPSSVITYTEETSEDLENMLRYFYGVPVKISSSKSWISTLQSFDIAVKYKCFGMQLQTMNSLKSTSLTPNIFWTLLGQNIVLKQCSLNTKVLLDQFGQLYTERILQHETFLSASKSSVIQILKCDCLNTSEYNIIVCIGKWLQKNCKDPPSESKELLKYIRFESLSAEELYLFMKEYDSILPKKDALDIFSYLYDKSSNKNLPEWCYNGPLRGCFYQNSTKIGTMKIIKDGKVLKGNNIFRACYIIRTLNKVKECSSKVQYLELAWKVRNNNNKEHEKFTCNINISFRPQNVEFNYFDIHVPQHQRVMVPVFFQVEAQIPEIRLDISITMSAHRKIIFPVQRKLLFKNMEIEADRDLHCINDAIVDGSTSEQVYIPKHLLMQDPTNVTSTKEWCR